MNVKLFALLAALIFSLELLAQDKTEQMLGKISFVTSNNIYVKFDDTQQVEVGDTLLVAKANGNPPCLVVTQKSSTSCVCQSLNGCELSKDDEVIFNYVLPLPVLEEAAEETPTEVAEQEEVSEEVPAEKKPLFEEKIRGRISAATYSNVYANRENRHRMMYRFSLNASNIRNSRFSIETYLNYRQNFLPPSDNSGRQTQFFRVYNLALRYDLNPSTTITLGRKINRNASSIGAIDGLQVEKQFGNYFAGAVVGFRPDIRDYGFNSNLLQYGAYFGLKANKGSIYSTTTLGFFEQRNAGFIDRRYTYLQHSSTINRKLTLFGSAELDLYKSIDGVASQDIRLSNLYLSARYRFSRKLDVNVSYDNRRRILYYETFKTDIEQMLDDDIARQGLRFRVNVRPIKYLNLGASYSMRFQSDQQNKSNNINGFASLSKVPGIGGRASVNFNNNQSSYLDSKILSFRYSRPLIKGKLNADFYFRNVHYQYLSSGLTTTQQYFGANLSYRLGKKLTFSLMGEMSSAVNSEQTGQNYRINAKIVKRFAKKRKK